MAVPLSKWNVDLEIATQEEIANLCHPLLNISDSQAVKTTEYFYVSIMLRRGFEWEK